jgi:hypothetical protein
MMAIPTKSPSPPGSTIKRHSRAYRLQHSPILSLRGLPWHRWQTRHLMIASSIGLPTRTRLYAHSSQRSMKSPLSSCCCGTPRWGMHLGAALTPVSPRPVNAPCFRAVDTARFPGLEVSLPSQGPVCPTDMYASDSLHAHHNSRASISPHFYGLRLGLLGVGYSHTRRDV